MHIYYCCRRLYVVKDVVFENNIFKSTTPSIRNGIDCNNADNISCIGNSFDNVASAINLSSLSGNVIVRDNVITNMSGKGIYLTAYIKNNFIHNFLNAVITNNTIMNTEYEGIQVTCPTAYTKINLDNSVIKVKNNTLNNVASTGGSGGITYFETPTAVIKDNEVLSISNGNYYDGIATKAIFENNSPALPVQKTYLGGNKHWSSGSTPSTGDIGDVIWNWNPDSGVLLWVCTKASSGSTSATWREVRW